jgi:putative flippase GtrA
VVFARFLLGGLVTYATTLLVLSFWLRLAAAPNLLAYAFTHATVLAVGFVLNRRFIFRATAGHPASQGLRFLAANMLFRFVDWCVYSAIALLFAPAVFVNVMAANALVLPLKYWFYRHQVFSARGAQAALAERTT